MLLERLRADFVEIRSALALVEAEHRKASEGCILFLGIPLGEPLPATPEYDHLVGLVFLTSRTFNPGSGAVASFRSNQGTRLVQNVALADKLLAWSGLVEELQEEEANLQKGVAERWSPFIASRVSIGPYLTGFGDVLPVPRNIAAPATRRPLIVDDEFINQVLDRFRWQRIALRDIEPVVAAVHDILQLLDQELSR